MSELLTEFFKQEDMKKMNSLEGFIERAMSDGGYCFSGLSGAFSTSRGDGKVLRLRLGNVPGQKIMSRLAFAQDDGALMRIAGNGVAQTIAFPSATWERENGGIY